jgi:hypothetical protein
VSDSEMGGSGAFMAIGAGGGAGMFGKRSVGSRRHTVGLIGASKESEVAVASALTWFARHQSPSGVWDAERYQQNCTDDPKCEPGAYMRPMEETNTALTGYALLCFLSSGYDHQTPSRYRPVVKRGIDYLLAIQKPDGLLGLRNYEHPIAAQALVEAYAMTSDPALRQPAQMAIDLIVARQNQDPKAESGYAGLGWDYTTPTTRNDASVTGWNIMALKSAYTAGLLNVSDAMHGSKRWLELSWKANNPNWDRLDPYTGESVFSYGWTTGDTKHNGHQDMAPVGLVCAVFLGHRSGDAMLETMANWVMKHQTPVAYPTNTYYLYYNTLGMFQVGGEKWKVWNSVVRDMLVKAQRRGDGCFDGSWDPKGAGEHKISDIGRVLVTAYNTLCLEVYYRYDQLNAAQPKR